MSTIKVDTVRPVTTDGSLTLQADVSGAGVTGLQIGVDPSNNGILISDNLTGLISAFANSSAPNGWLACDGSAISRTTYARLFTAIGTTWGVGDGSTTFNLPDLRGAFLRGSGSHGTETMADTNAFAGPSVGSFENDQIQDFVIKLTHNAGTISAIVTEEHGTADTNKIKYASTSGGAERTLSSSFNAGSYGTPRVLDETRPFNAGILYCIKF